MDDIITLTEPPQLIRHPPLLEATEKIQQAARMMYREFYYIAQLLADVDEKKLYEPDGFKSAAEYAMLTFHMKKTDAYNLLKIGREYTAQQPGRSIFYNEKEKQDFNKTQIVALLPLGVETATELIESEVITMDKSTREIKEIIKANKQAAEVIKPGTDEEGTNAPDDRELPETGRVIEDFEAWRITCYRDEYGCFESVRTSGVVPTIIADAVNIYIDEVANNG